MLSMFIICCALVYIIDVSGFRDNAQRFIWKKLWPAVTYNEDWILRPFFCSSCMTFWCCLLYMAISSFSWISLLYVCLLSLLTPVIKDCMLLIRDLLIWLIDQTYKLID